MLKLKKDYSQNAKNLKFTDRQSFSLQAKFYEKYGVTEEVEEAEVDVEMPDKQPAEEAVQEEEEEEEEGNDASAEIPGTKKQAPVVNILMPVKPGPNYRYQAPDQDAEDEKMAEKL